MMNKVDPELNTVNKNTDANDDQDADSVKPTQHSHEGFIDTPQTPPPGTVK